VLPLSLQSRPKNAADVDNQRAVSLEETRDKYAYFVGQSRGPITALRHYDLPWDETVHVCKATLLPYACYSPMCSDRAIARTVFGKGTTRMAAEVSAICEALERFSSIYRGNERRMRATYSDLGDTAIHPNACTLFSEQQYRERERWNLVEGKYNWIPQRFDELRAIEWSPTWSLTHDRMRYAPTAYCYFGYPFDPGHDFCRPDSNGTSAGNNLEEAIVHSFLELVEREAVALWWYNRLRRPGVVLDTFELDYVRKLQNAYNSMGRTLEVLDVTAHRSVPTFVAVSRCEDSAGQDPILGFGANFDPKLALLKALTELNQFLPEAIAQDSNRSCHKLSDHDFLAPAAHLTPSRCGDFPFHPTNDICDDVAASVDLVRGWGLEMLVLDQTRSEIGLSVVKVIVPGMRSWWARFAPGRLYSLPVQFKWLASPLSESELNPDHIRL
jgi:oxazoline/thiazoline synthase